MQALIESIKHPPKVSRIDVKPIFRLDGICPDQILVRFFDLQKFLYLLSNRILRLAPLRDLLGGDPFECSTQPDYSTLSEEQIDRKLLELELYCHHDIPELFQRPSVSSLPRGEKEKILWRLEREYLESHLCFCCFYQASRVSGFHVADQS